MDNINIRGRKFATSKVVKYYKHKMAALVGNYTTELEFSRQHGIIEAEAFRLVGNNYTAQNAIRWLLLDYFCILVKEEGLTPIEPNPEPPMPESYYEMYD